MREENYIMLGSKGDKKIYPLPSRTNLSIFPAPSTVLILNIKPEMILGLKIKLDDKVNFFNQ